MLPTCKFLFSTFISLSFVICSITFIILKVICICPVVDCKTFGQQIFVIVIKDIIMSLSEKLIFISIQVPMYYVY
jgi:hypothetical protein